jgi:hypothetical protein
MDMHHHNQTVEPGRMWHRLQVTGFRSLELPGPGAVAHMSLHQKPTMSKSHPAKETDKKCSPIDWTGGQAVRSMLATERPEPVEAGSAASVEAHIWTTFAPVNAFLQFCFAMADRPGKRPAKRLFYASFTPW